MSSDRGLMLRAALAYAAQFGFAVFPCRPQAKEPLTAHGCKDSTRDAEQIKAWWKRWPEANVGVATGLRSNIFVLDIDDRHGGYETLASLEAQHGRIPQVPTVLTPGGGEHRYFKHPVGAEIRTSAGAIGRGLDVRGEGGYVIAPPSVHPNGRVYSWDVSARIEEVALRDPPDWLLKLTLPPLFARPGRIGDKHPDVLSRRLCARGGRNPRRRTRLGTFSICMFAARAWLFPGAR